MHSNDVRAKLIQVIEVEHLRQEDEHSLYRHLSSGEEAAD